MRAMHIPIKETCNIHEYFCMTFQTGVFTVAMTRIRDHIVNTEIQQLVIKFDDRSDDEFLESVIYLI